MPEALTSRIDEFVIRQVTGRTPHELRLRGRALPYKPFTLSGDQRHDKFSPTGSPVSVLQVQGGEEKDTTIRGVWKDAFVAKNADLFGDGPRTVDHEPAAVLDGVEVQNVERLTSVCDGLRKAGQIVEVTWLSIVRRGIIFNFEQSWLTGHDVEWSMTFVWKDQGEESAKNLEGAQAADLGAVARRAIAGAQSMISSASTPVPRERTLMDDVNSALDLAAASANSLVDTASGAMDGAFAPIDAARKAAGILEQAKGEAEDLQDVLYSRSDVDTIMPSVLLRPGLTPGESLQKRVAAAKAVRDLVRAGRRSKHSAARDQRKLIRSANTDLLTAFRAREDQDLRQVATKYYGSPDGWKAIAKLNGLRTSRLSAGQVVLVPRSPGGK